MLKMNNSGAILLELKDISYPGYGPISLNLEQGSCIAIQGPSGTGKSLFLKVIADLIPHQGEKRLHGQPASAFSAASWRSAVGLLLASGQWWEATIEQHFSVVDSRALSALGLSSDILKQSPKQLSSGQLQRLSLLRLLANQPKVLLLDEPTAHLDEESSQQVESLIKAYMQQSQAGVIWVSHNQQQVIRMAQAVYYFDQGKLRLRGEHDGGG